VSCPGELHHLHTFDICESHRLSQGIVCKLPPGLYDAGKIIPAEAKDGSCRPCYLHFWGAIS